MDALSSIFDFFNPIGGNGFYKAVLIIIAGLLFRLVMLYSRQQRKEDHFELLLDNLGYKRRFSRLLDIYLGAYKFWLPLTFIVMLSVLLYLRHEKDKHISNASAKLVLREINTDTGMLHLANVNTLEPLLLSFLNDPDFTDGAMSELGHELRIDSISQHVARIQLTSEDEKTSPDTLLVKLKDYVAFLQANMEMVYGDIYLLETINPNASTKRPSLVEHARFVFFVAFLACVFVSAVVAFIRQALDLRLLSVSHFDSLRIPVVGMIPNFTRVVEGDFEGRSWINVDGHSYNTGVISLLNPLSPITESFRWTRLNLKIRQNTQVIVVTSGKPGEGKTTVATNLAVGFAQSGRKTLLIDCDLRRSSIHSFMGVKREPGLIDLLVSSDLNARAIIENHSTQIDDLYIVPAGRAVPNPAEWLGSTRFSDFMTRVRSEFDICIIDTPPIGAATDALELMLHSDLVVLVAVLGRSIPRLELTIKHVQAILTPPEAHSGLGVHMKAPHQQSISQSGVCLLVNDIRDLHRESDMFSRYDRTGSFGYGYGYGFGYGYGYGEEEKS